MATVMILTNLTAADITLDVVGETLPASGTLELDSALIPSACGDPSVRAGFAAGNVGVTLNGNALPKDVVGAGVLSDIAYGSISTP